MHSVIVKERSTWPRTLLALLVTMPVALVAIGSAAHNIRQLLSPCVVWSSDAPFSRTIPHDPCEEQTGRGETKIQACFTTAAIQGVILLAAALGIWGAACSRPWMMVLGGFLMILEMAPLVFSIWPLALLAGGGFLYMGVKVKDQQNAKS